MGSQTILDLISSTVVFGSLLIMALRVNSSMVENMSEYRGDIVVQENLVEITKLLEYDFRKIGYCKDPTKMSDPSLAIIYADSVHIKFYTDLAVGTSSTDLQGDGNLDILDYYVGPTSEAADTPNPNDRLLYRVENNGTPHGVNMGVTIFDIEYYDALKNKLSSPVSNPRLIQYLKITVQVEDFYKLATVSTGFNTAAYDTVYQSAYWRQMRLEARNLRNR